MNLRKTTLRDTTVSMTSLAEIPKKIGKRTELRLVMIFRLTPALMNSMAQN